VRGTRGRYLGVGLAVAVVAVVAVAASPSAGTTLERFDRAGISFTYPADWFLTTHALSNGIDPVYRFAVGTTRIHRTPKDVGPCLAGIARQLPETAVLAYLREALGSHRRAALPRMQPRPRHFRLPTRSDSSLPCFGDGGRWIPFRSRGRAFYLGLYVGPKAPPESIRALGRLVDGMDIDRRE
jgi:hypothetical protein